MGINTELTPGSSVVYKHDPDVFMRPSYRISPFATSDLGRVSFLNGNSEFDRVAGHFFGGREFRFTESGRVAIEIALEAIGVNKQDLVSIVTTSHNYYVSSCVTSAIEKHCRWNRTVGPDTSVIFVIHEFGCLYKSVNSLKQYGLPIIEDFAHAFASRYSPMETFAERLIGDYAIFSLPKFIPIQFGGIIVSSKVYLGGQYVDPKIRSWLEAKFTECIGELELTIGARKKIHSILAEKFIGLGLSSFFEYSDGEVPGAFLFRADLTESQLQKLKLHAQLYGIESSVFYGEKAFFLPCHQRLTSIDAEYFYEIIEMFIQKRMTL